MTEPAVPPESQLPSWIKYVVFGCGCLALLGIVIIVIAVVSAIAIPSLKKAQNRARVAEAGGQVHPGTLESGDLTASDGSWYDTYPLSGAVGDRYVLRLESNDFDAYLTVVAPDGDVISDDDTGGGTDAQVYVTLDAVGTWEIRANTLRQGESGDYTLTIERLP